MITGTRCSRSAGIGVQDQLKPAFTIKRNACSQSTGTRSLRQIAAAMAERGHKLSHVTVKQVLEGRR